VPRGDLAPMRSNNAERTLHPLWVKSRHLQCTNPCPLYPPKADMCDPTRDARFGPLADICRAYSITSSAALSRPNGTERPNVLAVLRLITRSNLDDCWTGKSAGFSPLRIRPV
jgi:hypothetical protein